VCDPILFGSATIACGLAPPALAGALPALFLRPALIRLGRIFFHVSIHNLVGSRGSAEERTRNFSTCALGSSIAAFSGPSLAGYVSPRRRRAVAARASQSGVNFVRMAEPGSHISNRAA
jgi:hypothetical protein